ncbi:hypothetical protein [Acinetobacter higginsii]|uniref:hypothetical protein n=1 Tax=Acinetobacter higginsii TaxID=70347 RepID=UPI001F4B79F7|nr:hypothetical protein [Acinetobacter higginsii]MCH7295464.1 hypothetical protein [Acinetobacter higginsii]
MQEYPKALYFGTVQAHQHKVVNGAEHEAELRELGFVDFADLEKEAETLMGESVSGSASSEDFKNAFVPVEQFDDVCEKLVQTETQLGAAQNERDFYIKENEDLKAQLTTVRGERDQFKAENDDLKGQLHQTHEANKQLQQALDSLQPDPEPQDKPVEVAAPDYSNATAKELREALDAKGIKYLQRDNVDTLRALLTQPEKTEE